MRRLFGCGLLTICFLGQSSAIKADVLLVESFDYTQGNALAGKNGGTGWSNAWSWSGANTNNATIGTGLTYTGYTSSGGSAYATAVTGYDRSMTTASNSGSTVKWFSFLSNFTSNNIGYNNIRFTNGSTLTGGIGSAGGGSTNWSVLNGSLNANGDSGVALNGATHLLLAKIDYTANTTSLWVDPNLATFNGTGANATVNSFAPIFNKISIYMGGNASGGNSPNNADEFRLTTSYQEAIAVPEPGTLLLGAIAAASGGTGLWWKRRKKSAQSTPETDSPTA